MCSCWKAEAGERPTFYALVEIISSLLEVEADYLELSHWLVWKTVQATQTASVERMDTIFYETML